MTSEKIDSAGRLNGWKEIAAFFGRDERTVKRWEQQRGLPVRRVPGSGRSIVYADRRDLEIWLRNGPEEITPAESEAAVTPCSPDHNPLPAATGDRPSSSAGFVAPAVVICVAAIALAAGPASWHAVKDRLFVADVPAARRVQQSPRGEALYLDAVYNLSTRQGEAMRRAVSQFEAAIAEASGFAPAYAGLAAAYNMLPQYTTMPADEAYPKARAAAERAIALDSDLGEAYAALAFNTFYWKHDFAKAFEIFERAIKLSPDDGTAHHWYALALMHDRRFETALREINEAQRRDPRSAPILANKALILFHAGRVSEALAILEPLARSQPKLLSPHEYLATIYLAAKRYRDFLTEFRLAAEIENNPERIAMAAKMEAAFLDAGERAMFEAMHDAQKRLYDEGKGSAFRLALAAMWLDARESALDYLGRSLATGEQDIYGLRLEPALIGLHRDSRFLKLARQVGFSAD